LLFGCILYSPFQNPNDVPNNADAFSFLIGNVEADLFLDLDRYLKLIQGIRSQVLQ